MIRCEKHGTIRNAMGACFWCDREAELHRVNASMERYDAADPEEVDSDEYQRLLARQVALRKELDQAPK